MLSGRQALELVPLGAPVPQASLAASHLQGVREMEVATVLSLARAIEARDNHTGSHVERVQRYSLELAQRLGLADGDIWRVGIGAILQVIYEVGRLIVRSQSKAGEPAMTWSTFGGVTAGVAVMYLTGLLVAA